MPEPQNPDSHQLHLKRMYQNPGGNITGHSQYVRPEQTYSRSSDQNYSRSTDQTFSRPEATFSRTEQSFPRPPEQNFSRPPEQNFPRPPEQNFSRPPEQNFHRPPEQSYSRDNENLPLFDLGVDINVPPPKPNVDGNPFSQVGSNQVKNSGPPVGHHKNSEDSKLREQQENPIANTYSLFSQSPWTVQTTGQSSGFGSIFGMTDNSNSLHQQVQDNNKLNVAANMQTLWSAGPSPLEKLLEQQKQHRTMDGQ